MIVTACYFLFACDAQEILGMFFRTMWNLKGRSNMGFSWVVRSFSVSSKAPIDMAVKDGELRVFIVSGEVSGDTLGSRLMTSLKGISPFPIRFAGVGGYTLMWHALLFHFLPFLT